VAGVARSRALGGGRDGVSALDGRAYAVSLLPRHPEPANLRLV